MEYGKMVDEYKNQIMGMLVVRKKRHEETGRVILEDNDAAVSVVKEFIEKPVITLEHPEAAGIYVFNNKIFDLLRNKSKESNNGVFDLSYDILAKIPKGGDYKLASYDISCRNTDWIDIESPAYVGRNMKTVEKIIMQMELPISDQ